jgi:hypothetical protein
MASKTGRNRKAIALVVCLAVCLAAALMLIHWKITGNALESSMGVSVKEKTMLDILGLGYKNEISIYDTQPITASILNSGNTEYDSRINLYVYNVSGTMLNPVSHYVDSPVHLLAGEMRSYNVIFVPPEIGLYYIKMNAQYNARIVETWGSFWVTETGNEKKGNLTNQTNITQPPPSEGEGTGGPERKVFYLPKDIIYVREISLEYSPMLNMTRGTTEIVGVKVTNIGNVPLYNIAMHFSMPQSFETDINPKTTLTLQPNASMVFVVSMDPKDSPPGEYRLDFEAINDYIKRQGSIAIDLRETPVSLQDLARKKITNYELLLVQIEPEVASYERNGYDVSQAELDLNRTEAEFSRAKELYAVGDYAGCLNALLTVEEGLRNTVFDMGSATLIVRAEEFPYYYLLVLAMLIVLFAVAIYRKEKKEKRPKLLEKSGEEV